MHASTWLLRAATRLRCRFPETPFACSVHTSSRPFSKHDRRVPCTSLGGMPRPLRQQCETYCRYAQARLSRTRWPLVRVLRRARRPSTNTRHSRPRRQVDDETDRLLTKFTLDELDVPDQLYPDDAMPFEAAKVQSGCCSCAACGTTFLCRAAESAEIGTGRIDPESGPRAPRQGQHRHPRSCVTYRSFYSVS